MNGPAPVVVGGFSRGTAAPAPTHPPRSSADRTTAAISSGSPPRESASAPRCCSPVTFTPSTTGIRHRINGCRAALPGTRPTVPAAETGCGRRGRRRAVALSPTDRQPVRAMCDGQSVRRAASSAPMVARGARGDARLRPRRAADLSRSVVFRAPHRPSRWTIPLPVRSPPAPAGDRVEPTRLALRVPHRGRRARTTGGRPGRRVRAGSRGARRGGGRGWGCHRCSG